MVSTCRSSLARAAFVGMVLAWLLAGAQARATTQHAAGVVIDTGERVVTVLVEFEEDSITGEQLLRRADVDAVFAEYGSQGKAVCSILGVGSPQEDCFREAEDSGRYWNYSRARDGQWQRSSRGVSGTTIEHGDVDGWAWGPSGSQPPYYSFEEIRARHAPAGSPEPSPTPTSEEVASPHAETASPSTTNPSGEATPTAAATTRSAEAGEDAGQDDARSDDAGDGAATTRPPSPAATTASPAVPSTGEQTPTGGVAPTAATDTPAAGSGAVALAGAVIVALLGAIVWRRRA